VGSRRTTALVFVSFAIAQFVSLLGDRLHQFSVIGMIGNVAPGSSGELFQFAIFLYLPVLVFAPLVGHVLDRANKVVILLTVDIVRGLIVLSAPALYHATGSLYAFYGTAAALSIANLIFAPAKSAVIPEVFPAARLLHVNAVLWAIGIVGTLGGFAAGGWLFDFRSWEWSFYADGGSYLVSVAFLLPLFAVATGAPAGGSTSVVRAVRDGIAVLRERPSVAAGLWVQAGAWGVIGILYVAGIAHLQETLPTGRTIFLSIVASAGTLGLLAGAALATRLGRRASNRSTISASALLLSASCVGIALTESVAALSAWTFAFGVGASPVFVVTETILQVETPSAFRGRVFAFREVVTKVAFLAASAAATAADLVVDKTLIILIVGLFLAGTALLQGKKRRGV
jgi:MFS family permease